MCSKQHKIEVAIIGGGLAGLYLAHLLVEQKGHEWAKQHLRLYEAEQRCGGRILGSAIQSGSYHLDLGPSWLWPDEQPLILNLVSQFGLSLLPQWQEGNALFQTQRGALPQSYRDPQVYTGAYRIEGGTQGLIEALLQTLPESTIQTQHVLQSLQDHDDHIELHFETKSSGIRSGLESVMAQRVILTLPPRLIAHSIQFEPDLQEPLRHLFESTPTWMAGQAKVIIHYDQPFWREQGFSGAALANYPGAVLAEVFDLCGDDAKPAALGAFMALPPQMRAQWWEDLPALVIEQLIQYFGTQAALPNKLDIKDWFQHSFTAAPADSQPLYEHPQYGHPWLQLDHWNDKLFYCGSETASHAGGYMEGALHSAQRVFTSLTSSTVLESRYA